MTKISELRGGRAESAPDWREERGIVASVQIEVQPGVFVYVSLGGAGLKIYRGDLVVGVTIEELVRLAVEVEPRLGRGIDKADLEGTVFVRPERKVHSSGSVPLTPALSRGERE